MEFSWIAFWATVAWKLLEGVLSYKEGTFSLGQLEARGAQINFHGQYRWQHLPMTFLNNWTASWGDLLIFPLFNALVVPKILSSAPVCLGILISPLVLFVAPAMICGILISYLFHRLWWSHDEHLGHIFFSWYLSGGEKRHWAEDITRAGQIHFWFMAAQVAGVAAYIFTPMSQLAIFYVSLLLIGFVVLQQAQAVFVQKEHQTWALMIAIAEITVIVIIATVKLA